MIPLRHDNFFLRVFVVMTIGIVGSVAVAWFVSGRERAAIVNASRTQTAVEQIAGIVRLLNDLTPEERPKVALAMTRPATRIEIGDAVSPTGLVPDEALRQAVADAARPAIVLGAALRQIDSESQRPENERGGLLHPESSPPRLQYVVLVKLSDGTSISVSVERIYRVSGPPPLPWWQILLFWFCALLLSVIVVRMAVRPLAEFAHAAEEFGRNMRRTLLAEHGPSEVRRAASAFNAMQKRIDEHLEERNRFLAAISHDLKTPITRMRLRLEHLADEGLRRRLAHDLQEMQGLVEEGIDLARSSSTDEPPVRTDLNALVDSLRSDFEEMGATVTVAGTAADPLTCRPRGLRRALSNIVDNAIKYGRQAAIRVSESDAAVTIEVRDDGPGIPPAELENVLKPFYRLEGSRSRDSGGTGLGLPIARNIVTAHGGELALSNPEFGGLCVRIVLPKECPGPASSTPSALAV